MKKKFLTHGIQAIFMLLGMSIGMTSLASQEHNAVHEKDTKRKPSLLIRLIDYTLLAITHNSMFEDGFQYKEQQTQELPVGSIFKGLLYSIVMSHSLSDLLPAILGRQVKHNAKAMLTLGATHGAAFLLGQQYKMLGIAADPFDAEYAQ